MAKSKNKDENDKFWITVSQTVNLGNYESLKIEMGFSESYALGTVPKKMISNKTDALLSLLKIKVKNNKKKK